MNLTRHNLIEASAGTGKTHAIETIVVRLLLERRLTLEQILVVTFTEKAAGELKTRLRQRLENSLASAGERADVLLAALDAFDQAPIFTLHSFCQGLLREFPLEQGQEFGLTLVSREELLRPALSEVLRIVWPRIFGAGLAHTLEAADFRASAGKLERSVLHVAGRYRAALRDALRPDKDEDDNRCARLIVRTVAEVVETMKHMQEERGLYTFDDMVEQVAEALDQGRNAAADLLLQRLRERYRCAIVDEFQDTDPMQWAILRRVFADSDAHALFLVGDAKQAIYGFRGADLPTYVQACATLRSLGGDTAALAENWRSTPALMEGLNRLFEASGWFNGQISESGTDVSLPPFQPVSPPKNPRYVLSRDDTGRAAINLIDVRAARRLGGDARPQHAAIVADEIQRLLAHPERLCWSCDNVEHALKADNIAILVFKRDEAKCLAAELRRCSIPFTFYKQLGLWDSEEALQIGYALEALARPDDRGLFRRLLLTRFFRLPPTRLAALEDVPDHHPARRLFLDWIGHAVRGAWATLFASMIEDSAILRPEDEQADLDRPLANLRHILGTLEEAAYRDSLDIHGILDLFRRTQNARSAADEGNYQPIDTAAPKVQIMTVHASKGLEFPVVFLAGGFTERIIGDTTEYRENGVRVFHVAAGTEIKNVEKAQKQEEQRRLLYVALTRARFKLYVPVVRDLIVEGKSARDPGPLCLLLRPALDRAGFLDEPPAGVAWIQASNAAAPAARPEASLTTPPVEIAGSLFPEYDDVALRRRIVVDSFSRLARRARADQEAEDVFGDQATRLDDDEPEAIAEKDALRGAEFGNLVHRVLEKIDLAEVAASSTEASLWRDGSIARRLLDDEIRRTLPFLPPRLPNAEATCRATVGAFVWRALKTPLPPLGAALCDLGAANVLREIEFLFPAKLGDGANRDGGEHFLTGFIDLIARANGQYFLVDWKTNLLDDYSPDSLQAAMAEADYVRQYRLYALALRRWLTRIHGEAFALERHLGGAIYVFLRGLQPGDASSGLFFARPTDEELTLDRIVSFEREKTPGES